MTGSIMGAPFSGTVLRDVRAHARLEGEGHPPRPLPRRLRARGLPLAEPRRLPGAVDARAVRPADAGEGGTGVAQSLRPEPGPAVGVEDARGGGRPAGSHAHSRPS